MPIERAHSPNGSLNPARNQAGITDATIASPTRVAVANNISWNIERGIFAHSSKPIPTFHSVRCLGKGYPNDPLTTVALRHQGWRDRGVRRDVLRAILLLSAGTDPKPSATLTTQKVAELKGRFSQRH
jgi:hypothetical protein